MRRGNRIRRRPRSATYGRQDLKALAWSLPSLKGKPRRRGKVLLRGTCVLGAALLLFLLQRSRPGTPPPTDSPAPQSAEAPREGWAVLSELLASRIDEVAGAPCIDLALGNEDVLTFRSSVDPAFQSWVDRRMRRSMALAGAAVALHPSSGRVIALSVYNADGEDGLARYWKGYPAASIFKIVTAAAALDRGRLAPDSELEYTGRAHTLYRRQLQEKPSRWSHRVTLERAFARSINPVFGKIGIYDLGAPLLRVYGSAFFFNQVLPCELPLETSRLSVPDASQGIAEVSSGFNRQTLLTPVQAAWMGAIIASGGAAPVPWIVDALQAGNEPAPASLDHQRAPVRVLSEPCARQMRRLMEATVRYGTCRRSFGRRNRIRATRPLTIGGKTGNINDREDRVKYDWFVGYALAPDHEDDLALSVLMFHGEKLGHRANVMAFDLIRSYFQQRARAASRHEPPS